MSLVRNAVYWILPKCVINQLRVKSGESKEARSKTIVKLLPLANLREALVSEAIPHPIKADEITRGRQVLFKSTLRSYTKPRKYICSSIFLKGRKKLHTLPVCSL